MSNTVVVLGAGASHGARIRNDLHYGASIAALDGDFFERLQYIQDGDESHWKLIERVIAAARAVSASSDYPTLETVFTFVEAAAQEKPPFKIGDVDPEEVRTDLVKAIALQLGDALWNPDAPEGNIPHYQCMDHRWLVTHLVPGDVIISFNYDCLIDHCLRSCATDQGWSPSFGYELSESGDVEGSDNWSSGDQDPRNPQTIKLLKLHGSLNWRDGGIDGYQLHMDPYNINNDPLVIPPEWNKRIDQEPFTRIWSAARRALETARSVVFVGYSMPPTDLRAQILFRAASAKRPSKLERLTLVNPDFSASKRVASVLDQAVGKKTRVIRVANLDALRKLKVDLWHPS